MAEIRDVTDQSFAEEVLESELPLLVDFWGDHCPACRQISPILKDLAGMTSLAYTTGDPVALAKALTKYAKDNTTFTFKAGVVEGTVFDIGAIEALATMPSREEILAKLLFLINAPAQRLVTAINGVGRNVAVVIYQGCKENKFSA